MQILKDQLSGAAASYLETDPGGLDVEAVILSGVGRAAMEQDAKATQRTLEQANEGVVRMIAQEVLPAMFWDVKALESVTVDVKRWPLLAGWVTSYTQHRVDTARPKLW